jgi:hypothetical protein
VRRSNALLADLANQPYGKEFIFQDVSNWMICFSIANGAILCIRDSPKQQVLIGKDDIQPSIFAFLDFQINPFGWIPDTTGYQGFDP